MPHDPHALDPQEAGGGGAAGNPGRAAGVDQRADRVRPALLPPLAAVRHGDPGRADGAHDLGRAHLRRQEAG
ncbi:hypothetical protein LP420_24775 [Massilia sp. B-10]|nr:hypothetical protein LP420_24775 [Massilia sp. B-10]